MQTLNVFELLYIFSLGFWVYQFGAKSYEKGLITHKMQTAKTVSYTHLDVYKRQDV